MQPTQKEATLLKDLKDQEQLCIDKYTKHSAAAKDPQLKNLFSTLAQNEQKHFDTLSQIEQGNCPQQSSSGGNQQTPTFTATYSQTENEDKKNDSYLCTDVLTAEKHASHLYDTCIFEFTQENVRNTLNGIQKQEQNHGKMIYDYMKTNCMYS